MSTPALARAEDALDRIVHYPWDAPDDIGTDAARDAVSAALHDPDDPHWLARVIYESTYPDADGLPEWDEMDPQGATRLIHGIYADAVRAAILGEA